jgi:hypothetical protein
MDGLEAAHVKGARLRYDGLGTAPSPNLKLLQTAVTMLRSKGWVVPDARSHSFSHVMFISSPGRGDFFISGFC